MVKTFQPNRAFSLVLIIGLAVAIFIIYHSRLFSKIADPSRIVDDDNVWKDTPSLSIMTRAYAGSCMEFYNEFLVGYLLFFPYQKWANSDVVIVLDDESELDHRLGTVLAHLPPYPKVKYEPVPSETTFCDGISIIIINSNRLTSQSYGLYRLASSGLFKATIFKLLLRFVL